MPALEPFRGTANASRRGVFPCPKRPGRNMLGAIRDPNLYAYNQQFGRNYFFPGPSIGPLCEREGNDFLHLFYTLPWNLKVISRYCVVSSTVGFGHPGNAFLTQLFMHVEVTEQQGGEEGKNIEIVRNLGDVAPCEHHKKDIWKQEITQKPASIKAP